MTWDYLSQRKFVQDFLASGDAATNIITTGRLQATGGYTPPTAPDRIFNVELGGTAIASIGTDAAGVAGTIYVAPIWVPCNKTVTGVGVLNGTTVGTDDLIVGLYAGAGGAVLANSALAGTLGAGADAFQEIAFTATYDVTGPSLYYVALQLDGTTHQNQRLAATTPIGFTAAVAGSFGTLSSLTKPTTFTAGQGPIAYLY